MSDEAQVRSSLRVAKDNLNYSTATTGFSADVAGSRGPTPGAILVPTSGKDVDLSQLTSPGFCEITNQDLTNFVQVGIKDSGTGLFYPILEVLPGETYVVRLSRYLGEDYYNTGTGTTAAIHKLHVKANVASCMVMVAAFDR